MLFHSAFSSLSSQEKDTKKGQIDLFFNAILNSLWGLKTKENSKELIILLSYLFKLYLYP